MSELVSNYLTPANDRVSAVGAILDKINVVDDIAGEARLIMRIARAERPCVLSFVNQHVMNLAWQSSDFAASLVASDILLRDGIGLEVCMTSLSRKAGRNMNGTDFIPRLAVAFAGRRVALFGTVEPWTSRAAVALAASGCEIVTTMDGFRSADDYVAEVRDKRPALVILAMGNPKQEEVAQKIAASAPVPMTIVNGGAIADFLARRFKRAPK